MSYAAWPVVAMVGVGLVLAGGGVAIFGGAAAIVHNDRLANIFILWIGAPLVMLGAATVILGYVGWWTFLIAAVLTGFAWLVRPRKKAKT